MRLRVKGLNALLTSHSSACLQTCMHCTWTGWEGGRGCFLIELSQKNFVLMNCEHVKDSGSTEILICVSGLN